MRAGHQDFLSFYLGHEVLPLLVADSSHLECLKWVLIQQASLHRGTQHLFRKTAAFSYGGFRYLDLYDKVKTDNQTEKASILDDVDFELELIHRDVINVQYILALLAQLYDADGPEQKKLRTLILDSVAGEIELRSKRELIQKFIEGTLPELGSAAEIPDSFEDFWEQERASAFDQLCKEEQLDAEKLKKVIDRFVYTGQKPLPDPDIIDLINRPLKLAERAPTRKRVLDKVVDFVSTFVHGIAV
ncbi:MAG TPA: hypothetical protein EYG03_24455 [Planctomycetes bacterium]|nr:hypothetical protein [Fuerstiella sp.]HIK95106.1 hypothetical protein [Planctomycetota bacterium]